MELRDISKFFDRTPVNDVVTGLELFLGQIKPFDDAHRDNPTTYRRTLSLDPALVGQVPEKVSIFGDVWLVGRYESDGWSDQHRVKYVIHKAAGEARVYTMGGLLSNTKKGTAYADLQWLADRKEVDTSSKVPQDYVAYLETSAQVQVKDLLVLGNSCLYVESLQQSAAGLKEVRGRLQEYHTTQACTVTSRAYSQAAGGFTTGAAVVVQGFPMRWQDNFEYAAMTDEKYKPGDKVLMLPVGTSVSTGSRISVGGATLAVVQVRPEADALAVHTRLA